MYMIDTVKTKTHVRRRSRTWQRAVRWARLRPLPFPPVHHFPMILLLLSISIIDNRARLCCTSHCVARTVFFCPVIRFVITLLLFIFFFWLRPSNVYCNIIIICNHFEPFFFFCHAGSRPWMAMGYFAAVWISAHSIGYLGTCSTPIT